MSKPAKGIRSITVFVLLIVLSLSHYCFARTVEAGPADVIRGFNAALLESMQKAGELGYSGRYKLLEPVIKDAFSIPFMASVTVGNYWRKMDEKQRKVFLDTYTEWTIASYAGQFDEYSGEQFEVVSESKPLSGTVTVVSKLIQSNKEHVDFYYQLRKTDELWRIVDIKIQGVSQLALTRSQFVSVIKSKGFDALIDMLRKKIVMYSRGKEK